jgi:AAA domain
VVAELETLRAGQLTAPPLLDDAAVLNISIPEPVIAGRLFERTLVLLAGPSGIGKTFLALDGALSIAANRGQWLGADIQKAGPWIYVAAEGAPAPRIGAWKIAHGFDLHRPVGMYTWSSAVNLLDAGAVASFIAAVKPLSPVGVCFDTFSRCFVGGDENSARDVGVAVANLDRVRTQLNALVIVLHHLNKGGTSERGSGALRGACDTVLYLQAADDLLQLTCDKQRDAEPFEPVNLKLVPAYPGASTCVVRLAADVSSDGKLTDAQGKALHVLREVFGALGATSVEWEAAVPTMHRATFYRARTVLLDGGHVRHDATGKRFYATPKEAVARCRTPVARETDHSVAPVAEAVA